MTSLETETDLGGEAFPEEFRGFDKDIAATQRFLSSLEGGADVTVGERQTDIEFGSDVLHGLQVATVEAASLNVAKEINLVGINPDGHAVINVVGGPLDLEITSILIDGIGYGFADAAFKDAAPRVLWNFVDATDIRFGGEEVKGSQWLGSIVTGPGANVETLFSHNGRLYVDGNFSMGGIHTELHNFPWTWGFDERPTGSFSITKNVVDPEGLSATDLFTGTWSCELDGDVIKDGVWKLGHEGTETVTDIPVGASCTVSEDDLVDPAGGTWTKEITPPDFDVTETDHVVEVVVTNTLEANAPEVGTFAITKKVVNESMLEFTDEFSGTWSCEYNDQHQNGTWTLADGETFSDAPELLVGTTCTVAEDDAVAPEGGTWLEPVIEPSEFTITADGEIVAVTVTNTLEAETTEPDITDPEVTDPEVTEPEVTEPEVTEPEVTDPEVTDPEVTDPEVTDPEVTDPEVTDPEVTDPEVTDPEVTDPEVTEPEVTEPEVTEPEVTEPEVTEPEVTEPEVTEPEVTEPEVTEPEVTEPEVTEPEVTEPEVTEPKEPGPGLPDTGALGTGTAIAGVIALIGVGVIALFRIGRRSTTA